MQTVRLLEPRPRTLAAKMVEIAEALGLERRLPKNDILAIYMTLAPFGGNLEGLRAASLAYLDKEPTRLSPAEAALLVAIPRSPERLRPDRHPDAARAARDRVLVRMADKGIISAQILAEARGEPIPTRRLALPFHAPHLARTLRDAAPGAAQQRTTINPLLQRQLEALLRREVASLDGSATLAAMVIENRDRRVLAHVGNAEFGVVARRGTLDMTRVVRSPGSTLKPFIYGMGFDRLILHPETMIEDSRRYFGDYAPSDFDGRFHGEVSAREALQYSLNVPAVAVLERLGPTRFIAGVTAAGIRLQLPRRADEPGLAIALGGAGITLTDLATLYVGAGERGTGCAVAVSRHRPRRSGDRAVRPGCGLVRQRHPGRGAAAARHGSRRGAARTPLSFKTGTSYGYRDAWAVGYDRDVTIAVWVGRPDGTPTTRPQRPPDRRPGHVQNRRSAARDGFVRRPGAAAGRRADFRPARSAAGIAGSRRRTARWRTQGAIPEGRGSFIRRTGRSLPGPDRNCRWRPRAAADSYAGLSTTGRCRWEPGGKPGASRAELFYGAPADWVSSA